LSLVPSRRSMPAGTATLTSWCWRSDARAWDEQASEHKVAATDIDEPVLITRPPAPFDAAALTPASAWIDEPQRSSTPRAPHSSSPNYDHPTHRRARVFHKPLLGSREDTDRERLAARVLLHEPVGAFGAPHHLGGRASSSRWRARRTARPACPRLWARSGPRPHRRSRAPVPAVRFPARKPYSNGSRCHSASASCSRSGWRTIAWARPRWRRSDRSTWGPCRSRRRPAAACARCGPSPTRCKRRPHTRRPAASASTWRRTRRAVRSRPPSRSPARSCRGPTHPRCSSGTRACGGRNWPTPGSTSRLVLSELSPGHLRRLCT
jgi:hypothetical protein